jgi:hypothetical protein
VRYDDCISPTHWQRYETRDRFVTLEVVLVAKLAIGHQEYLALERGRPRFPRNFTCSAVLRCPSGVSTFSITGLSPSLADHSRSFV